MIYLVAIIVGLVTAGWLFLFKSSLKRPPGPKGSWLFGALSMVASDPNTTHLVFHNWYAKIERFMCIPECYLKA
jgi:hypothetical protein